MENGMAQTNVHQRLGGYANANQEQGGRGVGGGQTPRGGGGGGGGGGGSGGMGRGRGGGQQGGSGGGGGKWSQGGQGNTPKPLMGSNYGGGGGGGRRDYFERIMDRVNEELSGPQMNLPPLDMSEKKFNSFSRLFVGNLPRDVTEEELKSLFRPYGELGQVYLNKEGSFAFVNLDYKINAEKAKRELQGKEIRNRPMKIRSASVNSGVRVKNLSTTVSNELLEKAFNIFGTIETCRVIVDNRGNPTGDGIVIFSDKKGAAMAMAKCQEECYFLTSSLRPVVVEPLDGQDEEEGQTEASIGKSPLYNRERKEGPRFAERNSFEWEYGLRWKRLYEMYREKKALLESDLQAEIEHLEMRMNLVRHEHETEKLRRELLAREAEGMQMMQRAGYALGYGRDYDYGESRYGHDYGGPDGDRYQQQQQQPSLTERYQQLTQQDARLQIQSKDQQQAIKRGDGKEEPDTKRQRY
ncbi:protein no-on-transient A-like [Macrobrachium rosenbergii]|uniref:protein no-on-transient A-like n=1 Tax=Macrobrachium rosenbergii TaxID=79674 RepID=UPI0034D46C75